MDLDYFRLSKELNIRLYGDERTDDYKQIEEILQENSICYSAIPTSGGCPYLCGPGAMKFHLYSPGCGIEKLESHIEFIKDYIKAKQ